VRYFLTQHECGLSGAIVGGGNRDPPTGGRGSISGLSVDARRRLMRYLVDVDWGSVPAWFVTLTYRDDGEEGDAVGWHRDLRVFWKRLERLGAVGMVWKLEILPRLSGPLVGVLRPHWHTVVFFPPGSSGVSGQVVDLAWRGVTGMDARTDTRVVVGKDARPVMLYMGKYLGKVTQSREHPKTGRVWGVCGTIPRTTADPMEVRPEDYEKVVARVRAWSNGIGRMGHLSPYQRSWLLLGDARGVLRGLDTCGIMDVENLGKGEGDGSRGYGFGGD